MQAEGQGGHRIAVAEGRYSTIQALLKLLQAYLISFRSGPLRSRPLNDASQFGRSELRRDGYLYADTFCGFPNL